ncbi:MAG: proline--tRNA ligase [Gammaproteobacteria bacterium]|nr:proline--tRNA ligase [Gammaproteobacteria bacterium]
MRASRTLIPTLKETPAEAEVASHVLLLRAGFIRRVAGGLYTWLPLGLRVMRKIEVIVREELERSGAQEIQMPVVQPAELWRESGRWDVMGADLLRMRDRHERDYAMGPTHEEVVTDLIRRTVHSYKDIPLNVYQIQTKFRDEIRPRFGLLRAREFLMKDAYSFHLGEESLERTYRDMYDAYTAILTRIGVDFRVVEADSGMIGDGESHEFQVIAESGEDLMAYCPDSGYAANVEKAEALAPEPSDERSVPIEKVETPGVRTIADVAALLGIEASRCVKTLIVRGDREPFVALVLRGDHELNETKAARLDAVAAPVTFAGDEEVGAATGCSVGSIGPVGLDLPVYADRAAAAAVNCVCGANEEEFHLTGVNWSRDFPDARVVDIRNVVEGDPSPDGGGKLAFSRGIEVGHIFKLGDKYSVPMRLALQDGGGTEAPLIMGCYGLGVSRLVAAVAEQCHDDDGIIWPAPIAPFDAHILALDYAQPDVAAVVESLYGECLDAGIDVLLDDRDERPGVKFAESDLLGIPHRITVGVRNLAKGLVEYGRRGEAARELLAPAEVVDRIRSD